MNIDQTIYLVSWTLIHFLWQGAVVGALVALALRSTKAKYNVAACAMIGLAVLPPATALVVFQGRWNQSEGTRPFIAPANAPSGALVNVSTNERDLPILSDSGNLLTAKANLQPSSDQATEAKGYAATYSGIENQLSLAESLRSGWWHHLVVAAWLIGMCLCCSRLLFQWRMMRRLVTSGERLPNGSLWLAKFDKLLKQLAIHRRVELLTSQRVTVPIAAGIIRPVVIVPLAMLTNMPAMQINAVLLHELAHIRRHDFLANLLQTLMETVFFFHPIVWWLSRVMRDEREHCCDLIASRACGDIGNYAGALAALEEFRATERSLAIAADGGNRGVLLWRVRRLLGDDEVRQPRIWLGPLLIIIACLLTFLTFTAVPTARAQQNDDESLQIGEFQIKEFHDFIGRIDSAYWKTVDVRDLIEKQQVALSPDQQYFALKRERAIDVVEVNGGNILSLVAPQDTQKIEWSGESLVFLSANGTKSKVKIDRPHLKLLNAIGRPETFNSVTAVHIGYRDEAAWKNYGGRESLSLFGLDNGKHWLATHPLSGILHVELKSGEQPIVDRRFAPPLKLMSNNVFAKASVISQADGSQIIRVRINNNSGGAIPLSLLHLSLDTVVDRQQYKVIAPNWVQPNYKDAPVILIAQGESASLDLDWNVWAATAVWVPDVIHRGLGPWPAEELPGRVWVRVQGPGFGTIPVDVTDPTILTAKADPADTVSLSFGDALLNDPSYNPDGTAVLPQQAAIAMWKELAQSNKLDPAEEIFAWWRIGSLAAYNFDVSNGESQNWELAEMSLAKILQIAGDRISQETLNAATVYGGLGGPAADRARRLAESYRWLFTRTDAMLNSSAKQINHNGYGIDDRWMPGGMQLDSEVKKLRHLRQQLAEHQRIIQQRISEEIQSTQNPQAIDSLLKSIEEIAGPTQIQHWRTQLNALPVAMVAAPQGPPAQNSDIAATELSEDQRATRRLYAQYINAVGKIPTDEVRAAIELVAARGRIDQAFRADVLQHFEKRCDEENGRPIKKKILSVMSKWLEVEGGYRWNHESAADPATQQVAVPNDAKTLYADSEMLARVIARGYESDRADVASFIYAVRLAHHPQGTPFLLDVLSGPKSNVSPFVSPTANPKAKWKDRFAIDDDERFIAAVGLAELGEVAGVQWLIENAQPNDFGDGDLNFAHHRSLQRGTAGSSSLRLNCRAALADLSGLRADIEPQQWKDWWTNREMPFKPNIVQLQRVFDF